MAPVIEPQRRPFVRDVLGRSDYAIISDLVEPGTKVNVDGRPLTVERDGTFHALAGSQVHIEAERDGKRKAIVRTFKVRKE